MLKPEQVPEAVAYEVYRRFEMDTEREAAEAIAAAINAWPGVFGTELEDHTGVYRRIILPLPKEEHRLVTAAKQAAKLARNPPKETGA